MNVLIEVLLFILFIVCVFLFGLHKLDAEEINELKDKNRQISAEVTNLKSKVNLFEVKLINLSNDKNKIEIVHRYDDKDAPNFPNSEGL